MAAIDKSHILGRIFSSRPIDGRRRVPVSNTGFNRPRHRFLGFRPPFGDSIMPLYEIETTADITITWAGDEDAATEVVH